MLLWFIIVYTSSNLLISISGITICSCAKSYKQFSTLFVAKSFLLRLHLVTLNPCIVKMYLRGEVSIKLNAVIEHVGKGHNI